MSSDAPASTTTSCSRCGAAFGCAVASGSPEPCWCTLLPPAVALPFDAQAGCWCPACLRQHIATIVRGVS